MKKTIPKSPANPFKPVVITSLHGFKSHGKWQKGFDAIISSKAIPVHAFDYGYRLLGSLIPGFKNRLVKKFYAQYCALRNNRNIFIANEDPFSRPSIVAHSLGTLVLCNALLKYPDMKFDKIILCGSIVREDFDWETIFKRGQVHYVRNEYGVKDNIVPFGWILSKEKKSQSGRKGFNHRSRDFYQEKFNFFEHGSYFEGHHIEEYWIPFFLKTPPPFQVICGRDISSVEEFTRYFDQTTLIDDACYGKEEYWNEFAIPDNLAENWVQQERDIYSFLRDMQSQQIVGYINAMPLKPEIFENLLSGSVHDSGIQPEDILSYQISNEPIDLYIMSVALLPAFQNKNLGLTIPGFEKLYNSLIDKLIFHFRQSRLRIRRIAAVGWTENGVRLCKMFGMKDSGKTEEKTNKPIYVLDLDKTDPENLHKNLQELLRLYKAG